MMTTHFFARAATGLALVSASFSLIGGAWAAPATSQELNGSAEAAPAADGYGARRSMPTVPAVATGVPQSRTVELLLQMQDKPDFAGGDGAKAPGGDSARRTSSNGAAGTGSKLGGKAAGPAEEPNPLANLKATMLGPTGANQNADTTQNRESSRGGGADSNAPMAPGGGGSFASRDDGQPRESLLSNPVVRFIRENRALTIGASLAVLIGLWATATFSMRRGR